MEPYMYIKFADPGRSASFIPVKPSLIQDWVINFLSRFIPKANPDFDGLIGQASFWWVEIEIHTGLPVREIGLDRNELPLFIMPWRDNYGFWTDSHLSLEDFRAFQPMEIQAEAFNDKWMQFERFNPAEVK